MADRDPSTGKFISGNKAATVRRRATEADYLAAMHDAITPDDWKATTKKLSELAKNGDVPAFRAIAPYIAGVPTQSLNITNTEASMLADLFNQLRAIGYDPVTFVSGALAAVREASSSDERIQISDPDSR